MSRWHRVRSGVHYDGSGYLPERDSWLFWCGQTGSSLNAITRDKTPRDGVDVCATCEGRAIGAGQEPNPYSDRTLVFTPRWSKPPRVCPGSGGRQQGLYDPIPDPRGWARVGKCLVCGAIEPIRVSGGPYNSFVGLAQHPPAEIIPPCSFHAWQYVGRVGDTAGCYVCAREAA